MGSKGNQERWETPQSICIILNNAIPVCDSLCNSFAVLVDALKCKLTCEDAETHEVIKVKEDVVDGTLCSYDVPNDICVRGRCRVSKKCLTLVFKYDLDIVRMYLHLQNEIPSSSDSNVISRTHRHN